MKCNAFPGFSSPVLLSQKLIETVERAQHAALNAWHRGGAKPWAPWQNHAICRARHRSPKGDLPNPPAPPQQRTPAVLAHHQSQPPGRLGVQHWVDAQPEHAQGAPGACNQKVDGTPCKASCAFQAGLCLPAAIGCGLGYRVAKDPCVRRKDTSARLDECKNSAWVGAITDLDWARLARHDSVGLGIGTKQRSMRCLLRIRPTVPSWHYCLPRSHRASSWRLPATAQKHQRPIPNATAMPQPLGA